MNIRTYTRGFSNTVGIIIVAILVLGGGWYALTQTEQRAKDGAQDVMMESEDGQMEAVDGDTHNESMMENGARGSMEGTDSAMEEESATSDSNDTMMMEESGDADMQAQFSGELLAGDPNGSPLLVFEQSDYEAALSSDKLVVLYFFAKWCPTCQAEQPHFESAFDEYTGDDIIGFRVNYNDNDTSPEEEALAREFGVAYQHTKVFFKDGERVLKSPESWERERYLEEFSNFTN